MKLADILANLPAEELEQLAQRHLHPEDGLPRPLVCNNLDGILRSFRFVQDFIFDRLPPTFAILTRLLEAPQYTLLEVGFRDAAIAETDRICDLIEDGELLHRDDG